MGESDPRRASKIYDLAAFRRARAARQEVESARTARIPSVDGGAWYHEAAIRDDDRSRRT